MGMFLNTVSPHETYKLISNSKYFVDKTGMLEELISGLQGETQYLCITRPRRFGKTVMANMIAAYFGKAESAKDIFDKLEIAKASAYLRHLNQHEIIYIDFSQVPKDCSTYKQYIRRIQEGLFADLSEAYPELKLDGQRGVWDNLMEIFERKNKRKFIFVIDEWDALFHMPFMKEADKREYLLFLKSLLKNKAYVELAFGFTEEETDQLFARYADTTANMRISRAELKEWYNGYHAAFGQCLYNPRSVVCALTNNQLACYWTGSGIYDSVFYYIKNNISQVRDDLALMISDLFGYGGLRASYL